MSDLDLLIAATALRHDLTLLTADRDFERVEHLNTIFPELITPVITTAPALRDGVLYSKTFPPKLTLLSNESLTSAVGIAKWKVASTFGGYHARNSRLFGHP